MYTYQDVNRPIGKLCHPDEDLREILEKTGVFHRPSEAQRVQAALLVREVKASGEMPKSLLDALRTKGIEPEASSTYELTLFCLHAFTRRNFLRCAREDGLREGEIDLIADRTMWKRGLFPIRMRPMKSPHEFRAREFATSVPFTAEEEALFMSTGPCSGSTASANSVVSVKRFEFVRQFEILS